jgi:uncharacterized protein YbbC (DUF1343 family)
MKLPKRTFLILMTCWLFAAPAIAQQLQVGAERLELYLPLLKNKNVALVANHTSLVAQQHLVDVLLEKNIHVKKVFAPEHGFRGMADAGATIQNSTDVQTGLPLISLYGSNKKPTPEQLKDIDIVVFDMQDVGARFYTYISTMHYVMEACAEQQKTLLLLDRPNPNGNYVAGPILQQEQQSFVGMHPIPIVHGLTVAELAQMINGEGWLKNGVICPLLIVKNKNYDRQKAYSLPVKPSPNLPTAQAVALYPSLCLFEGTILSVGRGTDFPFEVVGGTSSQYGTFTFTPKSKAGATQPVLQDKKCYGLDLRKEKNTSFSLRFLIEMYQKSPEKDKFFNSFFDKLAGNKQLRQQIAQGMSEKEIEKTWQTDLEAYKAKRYSYLLYP